MSDSVVRGTLPVTSFSERVGVRKGKTLQIGEMDDDLRNGLWNVLYANILAYKRAFGEPRPPDYWAWERKLASLIWADFFKFPLDLMPGDWLSFVSVIREWWFGSPRLKRASWNEVYDLVEFVAQHAEEAGFNLHYQEFIDGCNEIVDREASGYRLLNRLIQPITDETEIQEVGEASTLEGPYAVVSAHLKRAQELLADRNAPDYRNSMKESISAVESMCGIIARQKTTLTKALAALDKRRPMHPALREALEKLYGYTSDEQGVRHALMAESPVDFHDAKLMLVSCCAFVNFLKARRGT